MRANERAKRSAGSRPRRRANGTAPPRPKEWPRLLLGLRPSFIAGILSLLKRLAPIARLPTRARRTHAQHGGADLPGFPLANERDQEGGQKTSRAGDPKFHKRRRTRRNFVLWKSDVLKYGDGEVYKRGVDGIKRVGKPCRPTEETRRERKCGHGAASNRDGSAGRNDRVGFEHACALEP